MAQIAPRHTFITINNTALFCRIDGCKSVPVMVVNAQAAAGYDFDAAAGPICAALDAACQPVPAAVAPPANDAPASPRRRPTLGDPGPRDDGE